MPYPIPDKSGGIYNTLVDVLRVAGITGSDLEALTRRFDSEMPREAYAEVTERIRNCASNHGQAVTRDGRLWTQISTAKGAVRFARRNHGQIIVAGGNGRDRRGGRPVQTKHLALAQERT